jgi:hypothetical protein
MRLAEKLDWKGLTVQFSLPCNKVGRANILDSYILVCFKVTYLRSKHMVYNAFLLFPHSNSLSTSTYFSEGIKFLMQLKEFIVL